MSILRLTRVPDSWVFQNIYRCHAMSQHQKVGTVWYCGHICGDQRSASGVFLNYSPCYLLGLTWPSHWPQNPMIPLVLLVSKSPCLAQPWDYRRIPHLDFIWVIGTQKSGLYKFYRALFQLAHLLSVRHFLNHETIYMWAYIQEYT